MELRRFEYAAVQARQFEPMTGSASVDKTFDAAHVQQIHAHLFQDVFAWADNASAMSAPDLGSYPVYPESLVPVFTRNAVERTSAPASAEVGAERAWERNPNIAYAPGRGAKGLPSTGVAKPYIPRGVARGKDQGMGR